MDHNISQCYFPYPNFIWLISNIVFPGSLFDRCRGYAESVFDKDVVAGARPRDGGEHHQEGTHYTISICRNIVI